MYLSADISSPRRSFACHNWPLCTGLTYFAQTYWLLASRSTLLPLERSRSVLYLTGCRSRERFGEQVTILASRLGAAAIAEAKRMKRVGIIGTWLCSHFPFLQPETPAQMFCFFYLPCFASSVSPLTLASRPCHPFNVLPPLPQLTQPRRRSQWPNLRPPTPRKAGYFQSYNLRKDSSDMRSLATAQI